MARSTISINSHVKSSKIIYVSAFSIIMICMFGLYHSFQDPTSLESVFQDHSPASRETLSEFHIIDTKCSRPDDLIWLWAYIVCILYLFLGLAIVCDDYFVSSLEAISTALDLSEDVAGATFMAAGSSAPELFASSIGVFMVENSVGVGTIIGSAVFNILIIIGITCLLSGKTLYLDWRPLTRDSFYYGVSILLILITFWDNQIDWYEAVVFVLVYIGYVTLMKFNSKLMDKLGELAPVPKRVHPTASRGSLVYVSGRKFSVNGRGSKVGPTPNGDAIVPDEKVVDEKTEQSEEDGVVEGLEEIPYDHHFHHAHEEIEPKTYQEWAMWALSLPYMYLFKFTIPDCQEGSKFEKYYQVTFFMSIVWIGVISIFIVEICTKIGDCLNIPIIVMGLTVIAAGTSIPDAIGSVIVAREGQGDMAVANALGSNIFDICFGLGLPWMIKTCFVEPGSFISVKSDAKISLAVYVVLLFIILVCSIGVFRISGWRLYPKAGYAFISMYLLFVALILILNFAV